MQRAPSVTLSTIERNGREYWRVQFRDAEGAKRMRGLGPVSELSKRAAQRRRREIEQELASGSGSRTDTISSWADRYWELRPASSPKTLRAYKQSFAMVVDKWGRRRMDSITASEASEFIRSLENDYSLATARKHARHIKALFGLAVKVRSLSSNPFAHENTAVPARRRVGRNRDEWRFVTRDETERLIAAAEGPEMAALIGLARYAALRASEALALRGTDVRVEESLIEVRIRDAKEAGTKQADREAPASPRLMELIGPLAKKAGDRELIRFGYNTMNRRFVELRASLGFDGWNKPFHALRASCCNEWARTPGITLATAARWTGHSPQVFASRYHEVSRDELEIVTGGEADARVRLVGMVAMIPPKRLPQVERVASRLFGVQVEYPRKKRKARATKSL